MAESLKSPDLSKSGKAKMKLSRQDIKNLVSEPVFDEGKYYFNDGMVCLISVNYFVVKSKVVVDGEIYEVTLRNDGSTPYGKCSCATKNCVHMVATGLAVIQDNQSGYQSSENTLYYIEQKSFEKSLYKKSKEELIEMILNNSETVESLWGDFGLIHRYNKDEEYCGYESDEEDEENEEDEEDEEDD